MGNFAFLVESKCVVYEREGKDEMLYGRWVENLKWRE